MSKEKIESRRAFMKKFGKLAGAAAVAAPFMAIAAKEAVAAPDEDNPATWTSCHGCSNYCDLHCSYDCMTQCKDGCFRGCQGTCYGMSSY